MIKIHNNNCHACQASAFCAPQGLRQADKQQLKALVKKQHKIAKGEVLFAAGDSFKQFYIAHHGAFKSVLQTRDGREQVMHFHFAGELIGLDGVENGHHQLTVRALQPALLCEIPQTQLLALASQMPALQLQIFTMMSVNVNQHLGLPANSTASERLALFLCHVAKRQQQDSSEQFALDLPMSRHDIASYLGVAVETISRTFSQFEKQGMLQVSGKRLFIIDAHQLKMATTQG